MAMAIEDLFVEIDRHFLTEERLAFPTALTKAQEQYEKWFARQLSDLFTSLREQGHLSNWEREVPLRRLLPQPSEGKPSGEKIDLIVVLDQQPIPLEIKTLYWGPQGNAVVDLSTYFDKNPKNGYIAADVYKLAKIGHGYSVLFVHPFPVPQRWSDNVERFAQKMASQRIAVKELGVPDLKKYSPHLYIGKLEVSRMEG